VLSKKSHQKDQETRKKSPKDEETRQKTKEDKRQEDKRQETRPSINLQTKMQKHKKRTQEKNTRTEHKNRTEHETKKPRKKAEIPRKTVATYNSFADVAAVMMDPKHTDTKPRRQEDHKTKRRRNEETRATPPPHQINSHPLQPRSSTKPHTFSTMSERHKAQAQAR
jgi:hypothetical protein